MVRSLQFLLEIGLKRDKLRLREHLPKQLAHYAEACWDVDCLLEAGWTEIVGVADRSAYDLSVHAAASGCDLSCSVLLDEPRRVTELKAVLVMKEVARAYKQ